MDEERRTPKFLPERRFDMRTQHGKNTGPCDVFLPSRAVKAITCPHCWTAQRTERDFCCRCGAAFRFLDEERGARVG